MALRKKFSMIIGLVLALSVCACGLLGDKVDSDPDRKYIACRASVSQQDDKKGLMVIIENSGEKAFNVEWIIEESVNLAIKKGNMIVNKKSTDQYFHEALDHNKPVSGEVKIVKFASTEDKVIDL